MFIAFTVGVTFSINLYYITVGITLSVNLYYIYGRYYI